MNCIPRSSALFRLTLALACVISLWDVRVGAQITTPFSTERSATVPLPGLSDGFGRPIDVGSAPEFDGIAGRIYLSGWAGEFAIVILDSHSHLEVGRITGANLPAVCPSQYFRYVALDDEHRRLYVSGEASGCGAYLWTFDISQSTPVLAQLPSNPLQLPYPGRLAVNPNTDLVYVDLGGVLWVVDPQSPANPIVQIPHISRNYPVVIDPVTNLVYAFQSDFSETSSTAMAIINGDPAKGPLDAVVGTLEGFDTLRPQSAPAISLSLDHTRRRLYASTIGGVHPFFPWVGGHILVFDVTTPSFGQQPIQSFTLPDRVIPSEIRPPSWPAIGVDIPYAVTINPDTNILYVVAVDDSTFWDALGTLSAYDASDFTPLSHTLLPPGPFYYDRYSIFEIAFNPSTSRIYTSGYAPCCSVGSIPFQERTSLSATIEPGAPVTVGATEVQFPPEVAGTVTVTSIDPATVAPSLPGVFTVSGAVAYEIGASDPLPPSLSGPINICFNLGSIDDPDLFNALTIFHQVDGAWIQETAVTERDFSTGRLCVNVTSLSPFVLARREQRYTVSGLYDQTRSFRSGSTVPVRFQLLDAAGANTSAASIAVRAIGLTRISQSASLAVQDAGHSNPDQTFRYDPSLGGYVFNLQTKGLSAGTYLLRFKAAGDSREHSVTLQIR